MDSDDIEITNLIKKMRTNDVHQAEQKLLSMVNNAQFLNKIFNVMQNNQLDSNLFIKTDWVKTIAATFLNKVICDKLDEYGYKAMLSAISNIMTSYNVLPSDKRCFERSLVSLIEHIEEPQQMSEWRKFIQFLINDSNLFDTGLLLISCSAVSDIQIDHLCLIVEETFQKTINSVSVSLQTAMIVNELIKNWIVVANKLKVEAGQSTSAHHLLAKMSTSQNLAKMIYSVYQFNSPSQIWLCIIPELYQLNLMKYEAVQLHLKLAQFAITNDTPQSNCALLQIITQSYNKIKNTIAVAGASQNFQILQIYHCQDLVTSLIGLLIIHIKFRRYHLQEEMNILQHIICFPLLKTRDQEFQIFQQSPEEFNTLAEDLCDKQTFGILKTEAAKLLQTISDYSVSAMEKAITFCIQCIKMRMGYIPLLENTQIKILDLQTAFLILSIYSFSLGKYPEYLNSLKIILCDKALMQKSQLQIARIFLFLAYNYGEIFKNPFDGIFWVDFALSFQSHPTTRYMGLDFVSNIVDEFFTQKLFNQLVKLIIEGLPRQSGQVWNIMFKLFTAQKSEINENLCLNLVNTIFIRIQRQIKQLSDNKKQQTINLINALHLLRKIVEQKQYMNEKQKLKIRIFDIIHLYNYGIQFNFEDQIIKIMIQYTKFDQQSIQKILQFIPTILDQFKKEGFCEKHYFILFNEIIVKSKFQSIKPIMKCLMTGLMHHLFDMSENAKKNKMKVAVANILTLFQNMLSVHGFEMSGDHENYLCEIGSMCVRLFPGDNEKIFSKPLLAKALNLMFICHLYSKTENTLQWLKNYAKFNIFHKYDAFVLVKLLSKALFGEQNLNHVIDYLNLMIGITNLNEENSKKQSGVSRSKGKLKLKRDDEMNDLIFKITSPFIDFPQIKKSQSFPIRKQVSECLSKMRSTNIDTFKLIMMKIEEQQKQKLASVLNQTFEVEGKKRLIRKVVGVRTVPENSPLQDQDNQENQNDQISFKRKRALFKKKENKKNKKIAISTE